MNGILVVAKPPGPTSHDVVALVRRLTGTRRVGHGGTLDPFASGVLPVFLGLATRVVEYHMGDSKAYRATVCFGASSPTDDRDGELVPGAGPAPSRATVEAALAGFRGQIDQRPPAFSALKVGGRRAYQLAREGNAPELAPRAVSINRLDLVDWDGTDPERPVAVLEVECGAGTYIRSLARDLGELLGCGAYLGALVRTASGPFRLDEAHELDRLREAARAGWDDLAALVLPIDTGLMHMPTVVLEEAEVAAVARGQQVRLGRRLQVQQGERIRILDPAGALIGMGAWRGGRVVPEKMFVTPAGPVRPAPRPARKLVSQLVEPRLRQIVAPDRALVIAGLDALGADLGRLYVAVGVFDGLHRGHLYLLRELRGVAQRAGARAAVITFDAHPDEVIRGSAPPLLCDPDERLVRLAAAGAEVTVVQHFDAALRATSYEEFVARIRSHVDLAGFLMTPDAAFGYERMGTPQALAALAERDGFEVTVVPSLLVEGEPVRSSEIRRLVALGELADVQRLLGRSLAVTGRARPEVVTSAPGAVSAQLEFALPAALPPAGRYPVLVGPAWGPGLATEPASRSAAAVIGESGVVVEGFPADRAGERVRAVFVAPHGSEAGLPRS